tara:strand:- start:35 stop:508 length:474 start_codon:yes stop_codon:yes gene_type:complete
MRSISLSLILFGTWLLWSGHFEPILLGFGVFSCVFVTFLNKKMERYEGVSHENRLGLRWIGYGPWLLWEIAKANWDVARIILKPSLPIKPRLMRIRASQKTDLAKVIYANSITLTPGTITLDVRDDKFLVHALSDEAAADLDTGEMDRRVSAMEGKS